MIVKIKTIENLKHFIISFKAEKEAITIFYIVMNNLKLGIVFLFLVEHYAIKQFTC